MFPHGTGERASHPTCNAGAGEPPPLHGAREKTKKNGKNKKIAPRASNTTLSATMVNKGEQTGQPLKALYLKKTRNTYKNLRSRMTCL